ncbi:unnamed protein product [Brassica oleracea]
MYCVTQITFYYSFHLPFSSYFTYKGLALTYTSATSSQPLSVLNGGLVHTIV